MTVTIKQVAREAGVSVATVSRVLNGKGPVLPATRQRIEEVAARLRYVPHGGARSLITRKTQALGVLLPDIYGEFFSEVIRGIDLAARQQGYHLLVSGSHSDRGEIEALLRATRGRVDGLVVMSPDIDSEALETNLPDTLPIVVLNCRVMRSTFDSISIDNFGGAFSMARHLLVLGHRRIAIVKGPEVNHDARERLHGFRDALVAAGLRSEPDLEVDGHFNEEGGWEAGKRILAMARRPAAVFAANDAMAIGVLSAFREAGVEVPAEIAIAGFDDVPIARFVAPPLSSVRVPIAELGRRAVERLLHAIAAKNHHARRHETLPTELVIRESCGAKLVRVP